MTLTNALPLMLTALLLSGCAGMNDDFSCKKIDGLSGCQSMTDINNIVSDGKISSDEQGHITRHLGGDDSVKKSPSAKIKRVLFTALKNPQTPRRSMDKTATITLFSYKDSDGNYHATHTIYTVVEPAHWVDPKE